MDYNSCSIIKKYHKNTSKLFTLILFVLGFACMLIPNAMGINYNVTDEASLNNSFANASSGDTVNITSNIILTGNTTHVTNGGFSIEGNAHSIDGVNAYSIITLGSNNISSINNITLTQGNASNGGAINAGSDFIGTIENSSFIGNNATNYGGAIYIHNNFTGNIFNVNFTSNNATKDGGAIYVDSVFNGNIRNSNFENNTANNSRGGAIYVGSDFNGTITNTRFTGNNATTATFGGGAIYVYSDFNGTITTSNFENNTAIAGYGGAIDVGSNLNGNITASNFTGNTGQYGGVLYVPSFLSGNIVNSNFNNNTATQDGGAIYVDSLNGSITNSNFIFNNASNGGAIYVNNDLSGNITNSNFINSTTIDDGGAIYVFKNLKGSITNSSFNSNVALHGGAIYAQNIFNGSITSSSFTSNNASNGGAIEVSFLKGTITNSSFTNNIATNDGGAIYVSSALSGNITNSSFTNNIATDNGGAISSDTLNGSITGTNFTSNTAMGGGAIGSSALSGIITNSIFTNNEAANFGGAIVSADISGNIVNSVFSGNNANISGGAIATNNLTGTIINSNFVNNIALSYAGAVGANSLSGNITSSNFTGNTAQSGGAIAANSLNSAIIDSHFISNIATGFGGAIYVNGTDPLNNLIILANAGQETIFQNNMDSSGANSIYFANGGGNVALTLTGSGLVQLLDPMRAEMNATGQTLTIIRDNSAGSGGSLLWAGINRLAADNGVNVNFVDGYTEFQKDFSLVANNSKMIVNMGENHDLALNTAGRASSLAAFDLTHASAGSSFNIATTTKIVSPRSFLVSNGTYLLVDNTADAVSLQPKFLVQNSSIFKADVIVNGTQLWLSIAYDPYTPTPTPTPTPLPYPNPYAAQTALEQWLVDTTPGTTLSDADFRALVNDIRSTVPEHIMDSALISLNIHRKVVNSALANAFGKGTSADLRSLSVNNFASLGLVNDAQISTQKATPIVGLHLWTGYIGDFQNVEQSEGYVGYDVDTNGLLLGGTYDIGEKLAVGAFGGYSHSSANFDGMHANGDTDGTHFGLFGRYIADCGISTTLDTAYSHFSNSYTRTPDGLDASSADYGQDVFSLGLGFNYDYLPIKNLRISPYVNARSTWLKQDSANETGSLGTHLNSLNANSFTTSLGSTISYDSIFSDKAMLTSSLLLGYMHEFGNVQPSSNANFLAPTLDGAEHIGFVVKSGKQGRDVFQTGLSFDGKFTTKNGQDWGLTASYGLEIRGHSTTNSVYGGVHFDF